MTTEQVLDKVSTSSSPSDLRITDLKVAVVGSDGFGYGCPFFVSGVTGISDAQNLHRHTVCGSGVNPTHSGSYSVSRLAAIFTASLLASTNT